VELHLSITVHSPGTDLGPYISISVHDQSEEMNHRFAYLLETDQGIPACPRETSIYPWAIAVTDSISAKLQQEWVSRIDPASQKLMLDWREPKKA
jgi:hypothetical protein